MFGTIVGFVASEGVWTLARQAGKSLVPAGASVGKKLLLNAGFAGVGLLVGQAVEDSIRRACEEARDTLEEMAGLEIVED